MNELSGSVHIHMPFLSYPLACLPASCLLTSSMATSKKVRWSEGKSVRSIVLTSSWTMSRISFDADTSYMNGTATAMQGVGAG